MPFATNKPHLSLCNKHRFGLPCGSVCPFRFFFSYPARDVIVGDDANTSSRVSIFCLTERKGEMFLKKKVADALSKDVLISDEMEKSISIWRDCYRDKASWLTGEVKSLNLCAAIASEFARQVTLELSSVVTGSERAKVINESYQKILSSVRTYVEYACALGGAVFKPYVEDGRIEVEYIGADNFFPTKLNGSGEVVSAAFCEQKKVSQKTYLRLEHHELTKQGVEITNRAFMAGALFNTLTEVPLSRVDEWKDLEPYIFLKGVKRPLFSYFRIPFANNIDLRSPLGVSVFSRALGVIEEADRQYSRLLWEFEGGELAIDASIDAVKSVGNDFKMPHLSKRLFRGLDIDSGGSDLYSVFAPQLRDASLINGLDQLLVRVEDLVGLARGVFSNAEAGIRTATELNLLRQRTYSSVTDIQKALALALTGLADAMDTYCDIYSLTPHGKYSVSFDFDDSTVTDRQTEFTERQALVKSGILEKWEMRAWYLGEAEDVAKTAIKSLEKKENEV